MRLDVRRLAISFSGGETSAFMTYLILTKYASRWDEIVILFMNTSRENEAALEFVDRCDRELFQPLGACVVWLEAEVYHGVRKRCGGNVVSFNTASRDGSIFEAVIRKYGIPNKAYPHCSRELKLSPFYSYLEDYGWSPGSYDVAIGIRADEIDRIAKDAGSKRIIYPLVSLHPTTKPMVNTWFRKQPFRLGQKGYQGNCKACWKKSFRKLYTLARETPRDFMFPIEMESKYGRIRGDDARVFFRQKTEAAQVLYEGLGTIGTGFKLAEDDAVIYDEFLDTGGSCDAGETCEPFNTDGGDAL